MPEKYCPVGCEKTTSMTEWIKKQDPNANIACSLAVTCNWYEDELKEQGRKDLAKQLREVRSKGENTDPVEVCQAMDDIKAEVFEPLRNRLFDFDCSTQLFGVEC